jgi:ATP-dependent exoDNAse (exonuclease V) beta subunit
MDPPSDPLTEVYNTERHLLYVARTRARDHLLVTGTEPASEFLDDLRSDVPNGSVGWPALAR